VPRKSARLLEGRPLLAWAIESARAARSIDRVVVSTDDAGMAEIGQQVGAEVPFLRPAELARDDSSKWDVFRHLVGTLEERDGYRTDVLVDLDAGAPLRAPEDVDATVALHIQSRAEVTCTAYEPERNPYFNMVKMGGDGWARVVNRGAKPIVNRQQAPVVYSLSPAVFTVRTEALWRYDHWSQVERLNVHVIPRERAMDVDTELDLELVELLLLHRRRRS
jgi:N-acylneuraminate cytidylyltransferase/CMP-N,N'-diacetyllegionaminic acid synthase